jgi:hypothetical protein
MKNKLLLSATLSGILAFTLSSCNNNNTSTAVGDKTKDTVKTATPANAAATTDNSDDDLLPNLLQIGSIMKNSELSYIQGLTNPISDVSKYSTLYEQDLNLGIYIGDLAYCTLNKKTQESTDYLKVVKTLSDDIGIGKIFETDGFSKRYQANINNEDSLANLVAELQEKVDDLLKTNKQNNVRVVMYSGAWIENMYIGAAVYAKTKNSSSGVHLMEQMTILENMLKVLDKYKSADSHIDGLYTSLKEVDDTYKGFDEAKNYNPDNKQQFAFTDEHTKKLTELLEGLHTKYIK